MNLEEILRGLIEPVVEGLGCRLWGIELNTHGRHGVLKIFIDADEGINVDQCAAVSRQVSGMLDVEDPIPGQYTLEVSSPGLDRRLYSREQFVEYAGATIKLSLRQNFEGKRRFAGLLVGVEGDDLVMRTSDEEYLFPLDQVERANVVPEIG